MRTLASLAVVAALASLGAASCPRPAESNGPQLLILSWDGAGDWMVDRLLAGGRPPHLARLAASGVAAEHSVSSVPTKTAAAFASLWTGCWGDVNGVTENWVLPRPAAEHTLLESERGYSSEALTAEPLYVTAAKAGKRVVVLSATQSYPDWPHSENLRNAGVPDGHYLSFSGFEHEIAGATMLDASRLRPATSARRSGPRREGWNDVDHSGDDVSLARLREDRLEIDFTVGDSAFRALVFDDPRDPIPGLDTVLVRQAGTGVEALLKARTAGEEPADWSRPFAVRRGELDGNTFFRLFELAADGSRLALYQRRTSALRGAHSPRQRAAYMAAYPGFHDTGDDPYRDGALGTPLALGGDGTAEQRMLEIAAFDARLLEGATRFALDTWNPDVLFHYSHATDDAGHLWIGILDPASPSHDPELAAKIWPYYARIFEQLDAWLGTISELAPDAIVALVSDHGMAGTDRYLYVNRALEDAGLLARDPSGEIDLARTRILAAESPFFLRVNQSAWKGGIVEPSERDAIVEAAAEALLAVEDPRTGRPAFPRVFRPEDFPDHGIRGVGDLYFDVAPGYYPKNGASEILFGPADSSWSEGNHGYWPERRDMHAIFYAAGPGLARGAVIPPIRHIDVAPTLAHLAGFPAPPQTTGRVVEAMLAE